MTSSSLSRRIVERQQILDALADDGLFVVRDDEDRHAGKRRRRSGRGGATGPRRNAASTTSRHRIHDIGVDDEGSAAPEHDSGNRVQDVHASAALLPGHPG